MADSRTYALLDVEHQLKIPLMTISSLDDSQSPGEVGHAQNIAASNDGGLLRSNSAAQNRPQSGMGHRYTHSRNSSLGAFISGGLLRNDQRPSEGGDPVSREPTPPSKSASPRTSTEGPAPGVQGPSSNSSTPAPAPTPRPPPPFLKPHIVSPTPEEFLLVTGTSTTEPAIGMFVNLDGDPKGPTLGFETYPREVVVDGGNMDLGSSRMSRSSLGGEDEEGYVLASTAVDTPDGTRYGLEIQRFDGEGEPTKHWLEPPNGQTLDGSSSPLGIRSLTGADESVLQELVDRLCQRKFDPFPGEDSDRPPFSPRSIDSRTATSLERLCNERELFEQELDVEDEELPDDWEAARNREGEEFVKRLAKVRSRLAVWSGNKIWWAVRSPLLLQLEARLGLIPGDDTVSRDEKVDRPGVFDVLNSFQEREARTELEFLTFSYLRQRAGLLLLIDFLNTTDDDAFSNPEIETLTETLVESSLDPRVVLSLIPGLRNEIIGSRKGIWIPGGVKEAATRYLRNENLTGSPIPISALKPRVLQFARRFLLGWRRKKGFGSIADEHDVFRTVDASLLLVLLELDQHTPPGLAARRSGTPRTELYDVVDKGVACFDRAVDLLESYHRLFVLSRLYQSRKMAGEVLDTWRRIVEGERDNGGELQDGELRVKEYLAKVSSQSLVRKHAVWLANRNPRLGAQVFAEDRGRAPSFEPAHAVAILREEAPAAVRFYLEHLVFSRGHGEYVGDLISHYLDVVLADLETPERREAVGAMYEAYRALQPPKPTFGVFLSDNSGADDEVAAARLRLLQLLADTHDYDAEAMRKRVEALPGDLLVPEVIILDGREARHENALRLLVHRLGDYDTAVRYCLRGGSSVYEAPTSPGDSRGRRSLPEPEQKRLFRALLGEFLAIDHLSDRVEQTAGLLERFGAWFDVLEVLGVIPDEWSVHVIAKFLEGAMRRLAREKGEVKVVRGLSAGENVRVAGELVEKIGELGPVVEGADEEEEGEM